LNKIYDLVDRIFGYKVGFEKYAQLNFIIQHFNLKPDEVFLIGDSLKDCDFAKSKGINFIGISRIFKPEDFQKKGCRSISSLSGLIKFFDKKE
jgi:phosphoglycolate phosphatase-like HAD superfamily hydrolase